jgi:hypothetical protein
MFIASLALFVALGGGAALASGLISGTKIVNHSIAEKKLTADAIKALRGQRGPAGAQGPNGATGAQGYRAPKATQARSGQAAQPWRVSGGKLRRFGDDRVTDAWGRATYLITGNTTVIDGSAAASRVCMLDDSIGGRIDSNSTSTDTATPRASLLAPFVTNGSTVKIDCVSSDPNDSAVWTHHGDQGRIGKR